MVSLDPQENEATQVNVREKYSVLLLWMKKLEIIIYLSFSLGLPGQGFTGPAGGIGSKGKVHSNTAARSLIIIVSHSVQLDFTFFLQVTKAVLASLALQAIQVSLVPKVTKDFQANRDHRVRLEK